MKKFKICSVLRKDTIEIISIQGSKEIMFSAEGDNLLLFTKEGFDIEVAKASICPLLESFSTYEGIGSEANIANFKLNAGFTARIYRGELTISQIIETMTCEIIEEV